MLQFLINWSSSLEMLMVLNNVNISTDATGVGCSCSSICDVMNKEEEKYSTNRSQQRRGEEVQRSAATTTSRKKITSRVARLAFEIWLMDIKTQEVSLRTSISSSTLPNIQLFEQTSAIEKQQPWSLFEVLSYQNCYLRNEGQKSWSK